MNSPEDTSGVLGYPGTAVPYLNAHTECTRLSSLPCPYAKKDNKLRNNFFDLYKN